MTSKCLVSVGVLSVATPLCSLRFGVSASVPSPLPRRCSRTTGIQIKAAKDSALWASPLGQATGCGFLGKHDRLDPGGPSLQGASGRSLGSSWQPVCGSSVAEGRKDGIRRPTDRPRRCGTAPRRRPACRNAASPLSQSNHSPVGRQMQPRKKGSVLSSPVSASNRACQQSDTRMGEACASK